MPRLRHFDLARVLATTQGWTLTSAERVNKAGWIAGYGTKNGQTRAFVLSPR
jgi:hypothetical protein